MTGVTSGIIGKTADILLRIHTEVRMKMFFFARAVPELLMCV
jgi:hypothetical protein